MHTLCFIILLLRRSVEWAEHVARIGENVDAYKMLFGRGGRKNLRGRPTHGGGGSWKNSLWHRALISVGLGQRLLLGFCEPNTVKFIEFLEELVGCWLLTKKPTSLDYREVFHSVHFLIANVSWIFQLIAHIQLNICIVYYIYIYLVNNAIYI